MRARRRQGRVYPACPRCGSSSVAWIQYGEPILTRELERGLASGRIVLGGCCITDNDPEWHCNVCELEFGHAVHPS